MNEQKHPELLDPRNFLVEARSLLLAAATIDEDVTIVMGNEASDMDSMVSSIIFAWFLAFKTMHAGGRLNIAPVINIPRAELSYRPEAPWALADAGLDPAWLVFTDEIDLEKLAKRPTGKLRVILVDHNSLAAHQRSLAPFVTGIIDHHVEEGLYKEQTSELRVVEPVGSCASLVTLQLINDSQNPLLKQAPWTAGMCRLLAGVIMLDTNNLDPVVNKARPSDEQALRWLKDQTFALLFHTLRDRRTDTSLLTTPMLLAKDVKKGTANGHAFVISAVPLSLKEWLAREPAQGLAGLAAQFRTFADQQGAQLLLVLTGFNAPGSGAYSRELIIASSDTGLLGAVSDRLQEEKSLALTRMPMPAHAEDAPPLAMCAAAAPDPALCAADGPAPSLVLRTEEPGFVVLPYTQGNVQASRKQVMPLLSSILAKL